MRRVFYAALTVIIYLFCGCSSGNNDTTILNASGKHPSGWAVADTGGEHPSAYLAGPSSCYECHGTDLMGGISNVSCFSASRSGITCHADGPSGHPAGWSDPDSHGKAAKALSAGSNGFAHCQVCHGTDFAGGTAKITCLNTAGCHGATISSPHSPSPWRDIGSTGARTHTSTDTSNAPVCAICHTAGANSDRKPQPGAPVGTTGCFNNTLCHGTAGAAHPVPYNNHSVPAQTDMTSCLGCHQIAQNTTSPPGCMNCHLTSPQTNPNNCVSCHQKPPGGTVYPNNAVSHAAHNSLNVPQNSTQTAQCDQCHQGLGLGTVDHLNRSRSRSSSLLPGAVVFGILAKTDGSLPVYDPATGSCAATYCHGNTLGGGTNKTPVWGTTLSGCGTCHGFPPPSHDSTSTNCSGCHPDVNATPTKHINGTTEVTAGIAHDPVYPGSAHKVAGADRAYCSGCHDTTTPGGTYPATTPGNPPPCSGCHLNMTSFLGASPGCWDCHGNTVNVGRPNGSAFPNRQGKHNEENHLIDCTFCHPYTSGSTSHGWSNRTKSSNAQVKTSLTWVPGSRSNSGTCATACHGTEEFPWYP